MFLMKRGQEERFCGNKIPSKFISFKYLLYFPNCKLPSLSSNTLEKESSNNPCCLRGPPPASGQVKAGEGQVKVMKNQL